MAFSLRLLQLPFLRPPSQSLRVCARMCSSTPPRGEENPISFSITPIATVRSPYKERFGIPRQPRLAPSVEATVELRPPFSDNGGMILRGLSEASHVWLQFVFHETRAKGWRPTVRPPRLGGKKRLGVLATRSPHRPNSLGMSVVKLLRVEGVTSDTPVPANKAALSSSSESERKLRDKPTPPRLVVSGCDLMDGTPVVDIKPYLPYADCVPEASYPIADAAPERIRVEINQEAMAACRAFHETRGVELAAVLREILGQNPKPSSADYASGRSYHLNLYDLSIFWEYHFRPGDDDDIKLDICDEIDARNNKEAGGKEEDDWMIRVTGVQTAEK
jgi:tRNA (adenine37-N6)-methyltransferase